MWYNAINGMCISFDKKMEFFWDTSEQSFKKNKREQSDSL